ncbi:NB-ARC domains-containing protein [Artemisia annua]|uniref:NB-ARC domains-containing protein n=1 Tax=Artemisia annua TaxID=35608 RepID=A0A2U1NZJ1_ARTAN|nr:NB-ARC domains-containing protein [Artemisia annua]
MLLEFCRLEVFCYHINAANLVNGFTAINMLLEKEDLIFLWMAKGFLRQSCSNRVFVRLDTGMENEVREEALKKYCHMSFVRETYITCKKFKAFDTANYLRTFLAMPIVIDEVPESVGNMKHLQYLNLSRNRTSQLPDNVSNLYNLQTLVVSGCEMLTKFPENFMNLRSLRHFDIRDTCLWNMLPLGIGELKGLQILSNIIVGENDDFPISGPRNLKNLHGKIYIPGLEQVKSARDTREVKLSQKMVSELELEWRDVFHDSRNETLENEVLSALMPHSDYLIDLSTESYGDKPLQKLYVSTTTWEPSITQEVVS